MFIPIFDGFEIILTCYDIIVFWDVYCNKKPGLGAILIKICLRGHPETKYPVRGREGVSQKDTKGYKGGGGSFPKGHVAKND